LQENRVGPKLFRNVDETAIDTRRQVAAIPASDRFCRESPENDPPGNNNRVGSSEISDVRFSEEY